MRCNQVTIFIERFGEYVPKNYPADVQRIQVYCDDYDSIYAALSKAYALAINELAEYENIGARTDVYTNEFSRTDYREMHGALLDIKREYENDVNLQYTDTNIKLCEDRIWVYENAKSILEVLCECEDSDEVSAKLKDSFGMDDYQIRKLKQMRFDMLTKEGYIDAKNSLEMHKANIDKNESSAMYRRNKKREIELEIEKLKAYFLFVEHYEAIFKLAVETETSSELEQIMQDRFGFTRFHAGVFKYFSFNEFSKEEQKIKEQQLHRLEKDLEYYS